GLAYVRNAFAFFTALLSASALCCPLARRITSRSFRSRSTHSLRRASSSVSEEQCCRSSRVDPNRMYTSQNRRASAGAPSAQCLHRVTFSFRIVGSARGFASTSRLTRLLEDQQRAHRPSKA